MNFKLTILLLSFVLEIKCFSVTALKPKRETSPIEAGQRKLVEYFIDELNTIGKMGMAGYKRLAEAVLADQELNEDKSEVMQNYLNDFRQFVTHVNEFGDKDLYSLQRSANPKELRTEQKDLFNQFKEPTSEQGERIKAALKKNEGAFQLQTIGPIMQKACDGFIHRAEEILDGLNETDRKSDSLLENMIELMRKSTRPIKCFSLMVDFFRETGLAEFFED